MRFILNNLRGQTFNSKSILNKKNYNNSKLLELFQNNNDHSEDQLVWHALKLFLELQMLDPITFVWQGKQGEG